MKSGAFREPLRSADAPVRRKALWKAATALTALSLFLPLVSGLATTSGAAAPSIAPSTFGQPVLVNDNKANVQASPVIATVPGDRLFVAWRDSRSGNNDVYASFSQDGASSFSKNKRVDDAVTSSEQRDPAAAVSKDGTILLAWEDNRMCTFDFDVYFTRSSDGGDTFSENVKVDDSDPDEISWQERPSITVTGGGTIFVAWTDDRTGVFRIRGSHSTDGGMTFSPSTEVFANGSASGQTGVALTSGGGRIYAAYIDNVTGTPHSYLRISHDEGRTFGDPVRLDGTGSSAALQRDISIAPMPGGGVVAAWEDSRNGNWDIYSSIVDADGTIIVQDLRVDDDTTGAYQQDPCVAVDYAGTIYAVWEDERDLKFAIRFAYLKIGSTEFTTSVEVARPKTEDSQRKPTIACTEPGIVYVVWQDDRAGTYDIYASVGYFPNLFDLDLVEGWNFVCVPLVDWGYMASTLGLKTGDMVVGWNSATATYDRSYVVGKSQKSSDFAINPSEGYWIYATAAQMLNLNGMIPNTMQTRNISVPSGGGWAAVGFASLRMDMRASDIPAMYSIAGSILAVACPDATTGVYKIYYSGVPPTDFPLVPGEAYWLWCSTSGVLSYSAITHMQLSYSMSLVAGWNLVTVPLVGHSYRASTLGLAVGDVVAGWNPAAQSYDRNYIVGISPSALDFSISPSEGYWVHSGAPKTLVLYGEEPTELQMRDIVVPEGGGFAIIGIASLSSTLMASDIPDMYVGGSITVVGSWDAVEQKWWSYYPGLPVTDYALTPGLAMFIWCTASGTLMYDAQGGGADGACTGACGVDYRGVPPTDFPLVTGDAY